MGKVASMSMEKRRLAAVIFLLLPLLSALNAFASFNKNHQHVRPGAAASYTAHLLHRDSPASPFRDENATQREAWAARLSRDEARVNHLQRRHGEKVPVASGYELSAIGEYYARLGVGASPKEYYMIMDTGSDVTWMQCQPCKPCFKQLDHPIFDPSMSATLRNISCLSPLCTAIAPRCAPANASFQPCDYALTYGDGSATVGTLISDTFTFNEASVPNLAFGCSHVTSASFVGAAGLLGLGAGPLSFPSQLASASHPFSKLHFMKGVTFSYCLPSMFSSANSTLTFSAIHSSASTAPAPSPSPSRRSAHQHVHSPALAGRHGRRVSSTHTKKRDHGAGQRITLSILYSVEHPNFYFVPLTGISVAGAPLPIPSGFFHIYHPRGEAGGGVIVDSGTSVTRFPPLVYTALRDAFRKAAAASPAAAKVLRPAKPFSIFETCYQVDHPVNLTQYSEADVVPSVVFHFYGGQDLVLPTGNVLAALDPEGASRTVCLAFASTPSSFSIIGNMQQQGFRLIFNARHGQLTFEGPNLC